MRTKWPYGQETLRISHVKCDIREANPSDSFPLSGARVTVT